MRPLCLRGDKTRERETAESPLSRRRRDQHLSFVTAQKKSLDLFIESNSMHSENSDFSFLFSLRGVRVKDARVDGRFVFCVRRRLAFGNQSLILKSLDRGISIKNLNWNI